jgi:hypothetical protein
MDEEMAMMFGGNWEKAEARIVDYTDHRDGLTGGFVCDYVADVQPPGGAPFRATFRHRRLGGWSASSGDFAAPSKGDVVGVLFDPSSRKVKFDRDDPRLSQRASRRLEQQAEDERLRQVAQQPPGTPMAGEGLGQERTIQPGDSPTLGQ